MLPFAEPQVAGVDDVAKFIATGCVTFAVEEDVQPFASVTVTE